MYCGARGGAAPGTRDLVPRESSFILFRFRQKQAPAANATETENEHKMCSDSCQVSTAAAAPAPAPPVPVPADCGALVVWTCVAWAKCGGVSGRGALLGQHPHWHLRHQLDDCLSTGTPCAPWNAIADDSCQLLTMLLRIHFNSPLWLTPSTSINSFRSFSPRTRLQSK